MAIYRPQSSSRRPPSDEDQSPPKIRDQFSHEPGADKLRLRRRLNDSSIGGISEVYNISAPTGSARSAALARRRLPDTAFTNLSQSDTPRSHGSRQATPTAKTNRRTPRGASSLTNAVSAALGNALGTASSQFSSPSRRRPMAQRSTAASPQFTQLPPPSPAPESRRPERQATTPKGPSQFAVRKASKESTEEKPAALKRSTTVVEGRLQTSKGSASAAAMPTTPNRVRTSRQQVTVPQRSKSSGPTAASSRNATPHQEMELDSDESSDDESRSICQFWQKLRWSSTVENVYVSLDDNPRGIVSDVSACLRSGLRSGDASAYARFAEANAMLTPKSPTSPSSPVKAKSSGLCSLPSRFLRPKLALGSLKDSLQTRSRALLVRHQSVSLKLWDLLPDNIVTILGFLRAGDAADFSALCPRLRSYCLCTCPRKGAGVRIIPNLIWRDKEFKLQKVSLPHVLALTAQNLNTSDAHTLTTELSKPEGGVGQMSKCDFSNSKIRKDATSLSLFLCQAKSMRAVDLSCCGLGDAATVQITRGLLLHPITGKRDIHLSLQTLILRDNHLTSSVAGVIAGMLKFVKVKKLILARNSIGDEGLAPLAEVLPFNDELEELDISENGSSAVGLCSILGALGTNRTLKILDFGSNGLHNAFGDTSNPDKMQSTDMCQEVCKSVAGAQGLQELHLWRCGLNDKAFEFLKAASPPDLQLNVASNKFSVNLQTKLMTQGYGGPNVIF